jgi:hypothetical protein
VRKVIIMKSNFSFNKYVSDTNEDFFVSWIYLFFFGSKSNYLSFEDLEGKEEFHLLLHLVGGSDRHAKAKEEKKVEKKICFWQMD